MLSNFICILRKKKKKEKHKPKPGSEGVNINY